MSTGQRYCRRLTERSFYILVTNILKRPQKVDKRKVLGRLTDEIDKIINNDSQTSEIGLPPKIVINTVEKEKLSSTKMAAGRKKKDWLDFLFIPHDYGNYRDEFVNMLDPFASMYDGHIGRISSVQQCLDFWSPTLRRYTQSRTVQDQKI